MNDNMFALEGYSKKKIIGIIVLILVLISIVIVLFLGYYEETTLEISYNVRIETSEENNYTVYLPVVEVISHYSFENGSVEYKIIESERGTVLELSSNKSVTIMGQFRDSRNPISGGYYSSANTYLSCWDHNENWEKLYYIYSSESENIHVNLSYERTAHIKESVEIDRVTLDGDLSNGWNTFPNLGDGELIVDGDFIFVITMIIIFIIVLLFVGLIAQVIALQGRRKQNNEEEDQNSREDKDRQ